MRWVGAAVGLDSPGARPRGRRPDHRSPEQPEPFDAARLQAIRVRCPELDAAVRHVAGFARMIKDLSGDEDMLTKWMGRHRPTGAALVSPPGCAATGATWSPG